MANITIGRYPVPTDTERTDVEAAHPGCKFPADDWECYIEPEDRSWILYVGADGADRKVAFWPERESGGAVIGEPIIR